VNVSIQESSAMLIASARIVRTTVMRLWT